MKHLGSVAAFCFLASSAFASASVAAGPVGEWRIADGSANVSIHSCGANLCGSIAWAKSAAAPVGSPVLRDMQPKGRIWAGTIINPIGGQQYTARISMQDEQTLKVEGCVLGGMVCGGQLWSRVK